MNAKQAAGEKSAELVEDGMIVGLGTGSTARCAIDAVGRRVAQGLRIQAVATSVASETQARELGIPLLGLDDVDHIDLTIDGADEIDGDYNMIKGGGGALLREKMVASCTTREAIVADPSKRVAMLGRAFPLPVEIARFGWRTTARRVEGLGCEPSLRMAEREPYQTDNDNYILDCKFGGIADAAALDRALNAIPGVVENGLFVGLAQVLVVGYDDGRAEVLTKPE